MNEAIMISLFLALSLFATPPTPDGIQNTTVIDVTGNTWTITATQTTMMNGVVVGSNALYVHAYTYTVCNSGSNVYVLGDAWKWFKWSGTAWVPDVSGTGSAPCRAAVSPDPTTLPPATVIVDSNKDQWTVLNRKLLKNGVQWSNSYSDKLCWIKAVLYSLDNNSHSGTGGSGWWNITTNSAGPASDPCATTVPPPNATINSTLLWNQGAPDLSTAQSYIYKYYPDSASSGNSFAPAPVCSGTTAPFQCQVQFPTFTAGAHSLTITASNGGVESDKSPPFTFNFVSSAPPPPSGITIK